MSRPDQTSSGPDIASATQRAATKTNAKKKNIKTRTHNEFRVICCHQLTLRCARRVEEFLPHVFC